VPTIKTDKVINTLRSNTRLSSVTAYNGIDVFRDIYPFITTVKQDITAIGKLLAEKLMHSLDATAQQKEIHIVPSKFLYGKSCAKLNNIN